MRPSLAKFYEFLDRPLFGWGRIALAALVIPLVLAFTAPLWKISMKAPQYPKGLSMEIYAHKLDGGHGKPVLAGGAGYSCLAELRIVEKMVDGEAKTPFLRFGDTVRIEMKDRSGHSIFGAIEQIVEKYER